MDVDGTALRKVLKKVERIPEQYEILGKTYTRYHMAIKAPLIATLMGEAAWHVTQDRAFEKVMFEGDGQWYEVIYPEETV